MLRPTQMILSGSAIGGPWSSRRREPPRRRMSRPRRPLRRKLPCAGWEAGARSDRNHAVIRHDAVARSVTGVEAREPHALSAAARASPVRTPVSSIAHVSGTGSVPAWTARNLAEGHLAISDVEHDRRPAGDRRGERQGIVADRPSLHAHAASLIPERRSPLCRVICQAEFAA